MALRLALHTIEHQGGKKMARNIHSSYYEDSYCKQECSDCKRSFIVGEALSENMKLACPYCGSSRVTTVAASAEDATEDMGCLGLYFNRYGDGTLMLYTEREFADAVTSYLEKHDGKPFLLGMIHAIITEYCSRRDGRGAPHG
jgi:DNA-directed RNA polymerase subunit RPC12/RpoP